MLQCIGAVEEMENSQMSQNFYEMYLEEMEQIQPLVPEEQTALLAAAAQGGVQARNRLVEGSLKQVLSMAKAYEGRVLPLPDVVQEANTALILAAVEYDGAEDWEELLARRVKEAVELAIREQEEEVMAEENVAARVNVLQTVSGVLAEELGREATVTELADKMKMAEDEIRDIMKVALAAVTVNGSGTAAEGEKE